MDFLIFYFLASDVIELKNGISNKVGFLKIGISQL